MEIFKSSTPVYKRAEVTTAARPPTVANQLSSLVQSVFGNAAPAYQTADGQAAKAGSSSGLFSMFAVTPSYATVPQEAIEAAPLDEDVIADAAEVAQSADAGETGADAEGAICEGTADEIVLL